MGYKTTAFIHPFTAMMSELTTQVLNVNPLVYVVISLAAVVYLRSRMRKNEGDNIPPFPVRPYPLVGHIPMLTDDGVLEKLNQWRHETGDIYSMYIGSQLHVVMCNVEILKEAFVKHGDVFSDRALSFAGRNLKNGNLGIIESSGPNWKEQRAVSMSILRKFGMGKNFLEEKIFDEIEAFLGELSNLKGEPSDVRLITNASLCNIICAILIGDRFEYDDPYFTNLLRLLHEMVHLLASTSLLNSFPWLQYLPGDYFKAQKVLQNSKEIMEQFSQKFIKENTDEGQRVDNFIKDYCNEMTRKREAGIPTHLDEDNLMYVISNLFLAGTETTSTTLLWVMLYAIRHPEEQHKVYNEILAVVGFGRRPSAQDKPNMNITNAFIMECQRLGSIGPLALVHQCIQTTQVAGYTIPAGTAIIPNLDAVLKDEQAWGDPLVFRPGRFLDKDNQLVVPKEFIPFSVGRRLCMGESMAKMELFLFTTSIIQRFQLEPEDPASMPTEESTFGITCAPKQFQLRFIGRD